MVQSEITAILAIGENFTALSGMIAEVGDELHQVFIHSNQASAMINQSAIRIILNLVEGTIEGLTGPNFNGVTWV